MADEDKSSKTEEPTGKKLDEAREKGTFAKAPEIGMVAVLFGALLYIGFAGPGKAREVAVLSQAIFENIGNVSLNPESVVFWGVSGSLAMMKMVGPFILVCVLAGLIAGGVQSGFKLTLKVLEPNLNKLNPVSGLKNIFSTKSLVQFGIDFLKFIAIGAIIWGGMVKLVNDPIFSSPVPVGHVLVFIFESFIEVFIRLVAALAIIAALNFLYQKHKTKDDLKMTKQEVKDEHKNQEMSPEIKRGQRRMAMRLLQRQMLEDVPTADVVVTNPTHFAVALKYERGKDAAPVILAKGEDLFARRIKALAKEHDVPMVENKPVARLLFRVGKVGEPIPYHLYEVVAQILSHVYRTHRYYFHRLKARRADYERASAGLRR